MSEAYTRSPEEQAREATRRVLDLVLRDGQPLVVVDSPPGAGKTGLVELVVAAAVEHVGLRVAIVTPRAEQSFDLIRRLAPAFPGVALQVLQSSQRLLPADLLGNPRIPRPVATPGALAGGASAVIGTAAKFLVSVQDFTAGEFDLLICDESYQLAYKDFAPLFQLARQTLLVGDPGQLPPLVMTDTARFEAAPVKVHWPVPREVMRRFPGIPQILLPVSRRLPQDTVELIQPSLYPRLRFVSTARPGERQLALAPVTAPAAVDRALDLLADGATIVGLLLPGRTMVGSEPDEEVAELAAGTMERLLQRRATWRGQRVLKAGDVGCADSHVASGAAVRRQLPGRGISADEVMVDTPEIWQGLQRPVMVVKHPLSGKDRLEPFGLEPGRWCVMLSRHQLGCVIIGRDGIGDALEQHRHNISDRPLRADNSEWRGRQAHAQLWSELERMGRLIRV